MRIIVLPVGRCRFLEENESGLRFRRNKIWRFTECTTPYNRPSPSTSVQDFLTSLCNSEFLLDSPQRHEILSWFFTRFSQFKHLHLVSHFLLFTKTHGQRDCVSFTSRTQNLWLLQWCCLPSTATNTRDYLFREFWLGLKWICRMLYNKTNSLDYR